MQGRQARCRGGSADDLGHQRDKLGVLERPVEGEIGREECGCTAAVGHCGFAGEFGFEDHGRPDGVQKARFGYVKLAWLDSWRPLR